MPKFNRLRPNKSPLHCSYTHRSSIFRSLDMTFKPRDFGPGEKHVLLPTPVPQFEIGRLIQRVDLPVPYSGISSLTSQSASVYISLLPLSKGRSLPMGGANSQVQTLTLAMHRGLVKSPLRSSIGPEPWAFEDACAHMSEPRNSASRLCESAASGKFARFPIFSLKFW